MKSFGATVATKGRETLVEMESICHYRGKGFKIDKEGTNLPPTKHCLSKEE